MAVAFCAYLPAIHSDFIWDDNLMVTNNPLLKDEEGLKDIWFSTKPYDYFPVTLTSFWIEWRLWGANPTGYNVANIFLHGLGAALFWRVLRRLSVPGAWLAAMVFALHPVCVASVAWIAERKNTLSLVFFLLTLLAWLRFEQEGQRRFYWLALGGFLLALLSKTSVVMLPVVLLGLRWWQTGKIGRQTLLRTVPFFVLSLALGLVTVWFQMNRSIGDEVVQVESFAGRLAGAGWALWFYIYKALAPVHLSMIYPRWDINPASVMVWVPGILFAGMLVVFWCCRESVGRHALMALGYFAVMLAPVLGFFDMYYFLYSRVADHWQYLPLLGMIALVVGALTHWASFKFNRNSRWPSGIAVSALAVLAVLTWEQARAYKDRETLWRHTLRKNPKAWVAHHGLAAELKKQGRTEDAMQQYYSVLRIRPNEEAHYDLGVALEHQGRLEEAAQHYRDTGPMAPRHHRGYSNLAGVLARLGRNEEAIECLLKAIQLKPDLAKAHNNLANVFHTEGQLEAAIRHYSEALRHKPDYFEAHNNLGVALEIAGDRDEALRRYGSALELKPDYIEAHFNAGNLLFKMEQFLRAERHYREALRLNPDLVAAHYNLGLALARLERNAEALGAFREALRLKPDFEEAAREAQALAAVDEG